MSPSKQRQASDLEEIAPNRFMIHRPQIQMLLKNEGEISGRLFTLTTWRREGLIARLRARTFVVDTLADQIEHLPVPPERMPVGEERWHPLGNPSERFSVFDAQQLRWDALEPQQRDGTPGVTLRPGWVVRRRKGRGAATFFIVTTQGHGVALRPLNETRALLAGYAHAAARGLSLTAQRQGEHIRLPDATLPASCRALLRRIAHAEGDALLVDQVGWAFAQELFARLGVRLTIE